MDGVMKRTVKRCFFNGIHVLICIVLFRNLCLAQSDFTVLSSEEFDAIRIDNSLTFGQLTSLNGNWNPIMDVFGDPSNLDR